jgi:Tol biopolymer transport system component
VLTINEDGNRDIHIWDMARKNMTRLTFDEAFDIVPLWTPDGKRIIFCSGRNGMRESVFWKAADGAGKAEPIVSLPDRNVIAWSVSTDGGTLFLAEDGGPGGLNIGKLSLEADRSPEMLLKKEYSESKPQISPDGRYVAYQSDASGRWEIYVRPFPEIDSGGQWQISRGGGEDPLWSPTGEELFYRGPDAIMAVSVETEAGFTFGAPGSLFPNKYVGPFDVDPNSEKFLVLKESGGDSATPKASRPKINIVLNWFEELKERVPVD